MKKKKGRRRRGKGGREEGGRGSSSISRLSKINGRQNDKEKRAGIQRDERASKRGRGRGQYIWKIAEGH